MAGVGLARVIWIPSAIGLIGSIGFFAAQPFRLDQPGTLKDYVSSDKSFGLKRPSNWKAQSSDIHGVMSGLRFEPSKDVVFEIQTDLAGSLFADISRGSDNAQANLESAMAELAKQDPNMAKQLGSLTGPGGPGGPGNAGPKKSAVEKLHDSNRIGLVKLLKNYKESAPTKTTLGGLEAVESEFTFTGDGLWGARKMFGKRTTSLNQDRAIRILYYGPSDQMATLKPIFTQMRDSIRFGSDLGGQ